MQDRYASFAKFMSKFIAKNRMWNIPVFSLIPRFLKNHKENKHIYSFILFLQKLNEKYELSIFKKQIKKGMNIIDIGANIGSYTIDASYTVGKNGRVFAFEPEPSTNHVLENRIKDLNLRNVTLFSIALSNKKGVENLYFDDANVGGHSFSEKNPYRTKTYIEVQTDTLDNIFENLGYLEKINIIKIDTQGAEGLILFGGRRLLEKSKPIIFLELWPNGMKNFSIDAQDLMQFLKGLGYRFALIDKLKNQVIEMNAENIIGLCNNEKHQNDMVDIIVYSRDIIVS